MATTASQRILAVRADYENGGFYSGRRRGVILNLTVRPRPGILASIESEWNRLHLAEGAFSTRVFRSIVNAQFSPWISVGNNLQYDTVTRVLGWQGRFRWILRPGNDFYIVYSHNWWESTPGTRSTLDRRGVTKFVYTHRL